MNAIISNQKLDQDVVKNVQFCIIKERKIKEGVHVCVVTVLLLISTPLRVVCRKLFCLAVYSTKRRVAINIDNNNSVEESLPKSSPLDFLL